MEKQSEFPKIPFKIYMCYGSLPVSIEKCRADFVQWSIITKRVTDVYVSSKGKLIYEYDDRDTIDPKFVHLTKAGALAEKKKRYTEFVDRAKEGYAMCLFRSHKFSPPIESPIPGASSSHSHILHRLDFTKQSEEKAALRKSLRLEKLPPGTSFRQLMQYAAMGFVSRELW